MSVREYYSEGVTAFLDLIEDLGPADWERPALGNWDVRALVGHTSRALSTIEAYVGRQGGGRELKGPVAYFQASFPEGDAEGRRLLDAAIEAHGREAGMSLGDDPVGYLRELAARVLAIVESNDDDEPVATPFGQLTLAGYLPTRTLELAVHGLDLARAMHRNVPEALLPAISASCELAGRLAGSLSTAPQLLLLLTGREGLPHGLTVL